MTLAAGGLDTAGALVAIGGGLVVILGAVIATGRWLARKLGGAGDFVDDLRGRPARPGVAAQPGVMERMSTIERRTALIPDMDRRLTTVEQQLQRNGGASLADAIHRVDRRTREAIPSPGEDDADDTE